MDLSWSYQCELSEMALLKNVGKVGSVCSVLLQRTLARWFSPKLASSFSRASVTLSSDAADSTEPMSTR